ncbi:hypothetical protein RO3G_00912 [Rhizopus delemar RA 99-880]|uniref:Uncharacterized protein n=1 Tax=Rhizopus delemar (strain RA 99-880 / ATCC MYA-4621 / FGSC 9543 / NRRL 43880) TaxID=246409 RepID=I1BJ28_RHIO9|nr:hypothetical protein RO3G_00912 [Rhizopus delemar RA 99-880]|eukprot:EIE76208.1 hypothetical protein RO3G_00912 [Rhizopus delemar RA 99-880]
MFSRMITHLSIVIVPSPPAGHMSLIALDGLLVWIEITVGFPDACQSIMALGGKDTQEINHLAPFLSVGPRRPCEYKVGSDESYQ